MKQPVRALFDATPLLGAKTGVGVYTENLLRALAKQHPKELELTGYYFNFLGRKPALDLQLSNVSFKQIRFFPGIFLPLLARRFGIQFPVELFVWRKYDVQLFTNFISLPSLRKTPQVLAIHDLGCFDCPEFVQEKNLAFLRRLLPSSIKRASAIITISEFTKKQLIHHFGLPPEEIIITPIPPPQKHPKASELPKRLTELGLKPGSYVLYVGTIEPRKNLAQLVAAYERIPSKYRDKYSLVLVGGKGWKDDGIIEAIERAQDAGLHVVKVGYVSEKEKAALYSQCPLFVLPSHYEGFGMPVLEAMAYGVPVATSDIDVLHEVAQDAAFYFNKDDPRDIALTLVKSLTDNAARATHAKRGHQIVNKLSWEAIADHVFDKIDSLVGQKGKP